MTVFAHEFIFKFCFHFWRGMAARYGGLRRTDPSIRISVPGLRLASIVVLVRVPVVFLAAPASQFKYYLSLEVSGAFFLMLLIAAGNRRFSKKNSRRTVESSRTA